MDILTELPPELSMGVLKYLTPVTAIKLRLVSKRYYNLLTSEEVCCSLSHQFITPEYNSTKALSSWRLHYENHVSRRLSFASGKPWKISGLGCTYNADVTVFCPETLRFVLPASTMSDSVSVQDLNTYPPKCVLPPTCTPDGSAITHAALLSSFVVVATESGHGYSWNLETHQEHEFKLPDSPINGMHGSGNLVAISFEGWVVIHDVQAQETRTLKDTRSDTRVWEGEEIRLVYESSYIVTNPKKQVIWMISHTPREKSWLLVTDSLNLETGEFVQRDICEFYYHEPTPFNCGNGLWLFLERDGVCACDPGRYNRDMATERIIFDQAAGRLTVEHFPFEYPLPRPLSHHLSYHVWGPAISADGLGCFIDGPSNCFWMLSREPGDEVVYAKKLDPGIEERPLGCIWFCDRFALLYSSREVYVARFRGIHDKSFITDMVSMPLDMSV